MVEKRLSLRNYFFHALQEIHKKNRLWMANSLKVQKNRSKEKWGRCIHKCCNISPCETIVKVSYSNGTREMMQAKRHMAQAEQEMALLYRKYAPGLLTYVRMRMLLEEDAEDLVVEVFMAAIENAKFATLSEKEKLSWLWRVTRNKVIDAYRRAKTRQNVTLEDVAEGLFEDEMSSPEYTALRQEDYMDLYTHLQSLPPLQQQILRMRFGQDLSCSEIATTLGKPENVVRVTLSRSLNLLRKVYRRRREEQESG
jgi:RNA polymerase sigma factor (sigma-70 family)